MKSEAEIRDKIQNSLQALKDFTNNPDVTPEEFFTVARQATYMTALYWVLGENVPQEVTTLAVPIIQKMAQAHQNVKGKS